MPTPPTAQGTLPEQVWNLPAQGFQVWTEPGMAIGRLWPRVDLPHTPSDLGQGLIPIRLFSLHCLEHKRLSLEGQQETSH